MELFCISGFNSVRFLFVGWDEERSLQTKKKEMDTPDELLARILDAAARIKERGDQFRRTTPDLRTRVAKCIAVEGGIFEHIFSTVTYFSFMCNKVI
jgi:hypothetical protein